MNKDDPTEPTEKELLQMILVQQMRNYDLLLLQLDEEERKKILEGHEKFEFICPMPWEQNDE